MSELLSASALPAVHFDSVKRPQAHRSMPDSITTFLACRFRTRDARQGRRCRAYYWRGADTLDPSEHRFYRKFIMLHPTVHAANISDAKGLALF